MKPCPSSSPSRFSAGTTASSKNSSDVSEACRPILSRLRPRLKPVVALGLQNDQRKALGARPAGARDHDDQVGGLAVGDEGLLAVDDVAVALPARGGPHALQVGAGAGLGHGDGADQSRRAPSRAASALLLLGAVVQDVMRDDAAVDRHAGSALPARCFRCPRTPRRRRRRSRRARHRPRERSAATRPSRRAPARPSGPPSSARAILGVRRQILGEKFPELVAEDVQFLGHPG